MLSANQNAEIFVCILLLYNIVNVIKSEGKAYTSGDWSSGNSTTKAESQSESTRRGHINLTYTEISTVEVGKNTEEGVRDAKLEMR